MKKLQILLLGMVLLPFLVSAQAQKISHFADSLLALKTYSAPLDTSKTRGLFYYKFKESVDDFNKNKKIKLLNLSWKLWKDKDWKKLEELFKADTLNWGYPPNYGADSVEIPATLFKGTLVDRYISRINIDNLGFHDTGDFLGTKDVSFKQRSLPDKWYIYAMYQVTRDITAVKKSIAIPWFGQQGGGVQYHLTDKKKVEDLKKDSSLIEVEPFFKR